MIKGVLSIAILFSTFANADTVDWQGKLAQFKAGLANDSVAKLWGKDLFYSAEVVATCAVDTVAVIATLGADTTPVANGAVQIVTAYPNYEDLLANLFTWNAVANTVRGTAGGGTVLVTDTVQYVVAWLGGDTSHTYQEVPKAYASSIALANTLFAQQGECMMSASKVLLIGAELKLRNSMTPADAGPVIYPLQ